MCNPMMAIGGAMALGSMAANAQAQSKVDKARAGAQEAERIRQRGYDDEAGALNTQSQDRYREFEGQQDGKTESLADMYQSRGESAAPAAQSVIPSGASGNVTVQKERAKQQSLADAYGTQQNQALAALRSFGDLLGGIGREQSRDANQIGVINSFKQGSSSILPYELEAANAKGNSLRTLGSVLGMGGNALMAGGSYSMAGPAGGGATPLTQQQAQGLTIQQNTNAGVTGLPRFGLR